MISVVEASEKLGMTYKQIKLKKGINLILTDDELMITEEDFKLLQEEQLFKSKSVTVTEAEELSGLSRRMLCNRLKEGEDWRMLGNNTYIDKVALELLIKQREPYKAFLENSITISQAGKISGMGRSTIRRHLKEGEEWINFDGGCYVDKTALERLMKEWGIAQTIEVMVESTEVPQGYSLIKELCEKNNLDYHAIRDRVRRDLKEYAIKVNNRVYLKDDIIVDLVEERDWIQNSCVRRDLQKLFDITPTQLVRVLDEIKEDVDWKLIGMCEYYNKDMINNKIAECGGAKQYYEFCKARRSNRLSNQESCKARRSNRLSNQEIHMGPRVLFVSPDIVEINDETFIKVNAVEKFYNLTAGAGVKLNGNVLRRSIKKGTITNTYQGDRNALYVSKKELDLIKDILDNSIPLSELQEELIKVREGKTTLPKVIRNLCPSDVEMFRFDVFGVAHYRFRTQNPKQFKADFIERLKKEEEYRDTNPHDRYAWLEKDFTQEQKEQFPFAIKTYREFVFNKLNNTKANNVINLTHELFMALKRFINEISVDICLLTDEEIVQVLSSSEMNTKHRSHFSLYLNYLRRKYPEECVFKNQYNRYKEQRVRAIDDIYTLEEWCSYANFLTDINRHIEKSFERYAYAKRWLYAILHFSVAWRSGDFLETPGFDFLDNSGNANLDLLDIDKYSLEWFKNNDFKLSDGQIIINSVKRFVEDRETRKTGARKHFIVPRHYVIPVSIAIIITEQHRRARNSSTLFSVGKIEPKSLRDILGEEMAGFSSRKANRSLISYIYHAANESEEYSSIAYSMGSYLRSHKPNMFQKAETTSQYIHALNKDGDINRISGQLFRRGVFGWLYKVMIELAYGKEEYTLLEMTTAIETLQKDLSANGIENISRFMIYELDSRRNVINELLKAPTDQLKKLIDKLILGDLTSKERSIYCIKTGNCPFPTQNSCKGCRYSIPTNYSLLAIGDELLVLLDKLSLVEDTDEFNRQKYTFQIARLLTVLSEAKSEFDQIDPDYFKTFVPLREIRDRKNKVEHKFYIG